MSASSAESVATLQRYFDAFNRHDVEGWVKLFHPDIEMTPSPEWAPAGTKYLGRDGMRSYAHEVFGRVPDIRAELPQKFKVIGDLVLGSVSMGSAKDPRTITCLWTFKDGQIYRVDGFVIEAEALEVARRQSEDQFRPLFQDASDALVLSDDGAQFLDANASASRLFGLSTDELRSRTIFELVPPELVHQVEECWRTFRAQGHLSCKSEVVSRAGDRHPVELRAKADFVSGRHLVLLARAQTAGAAAPRSSSAPRLTDREREVFRLLAGGLSGSEIAKRLVLSPHTIRRHVEKGIARLEAKNRVEAVVIALTSGEITL